MKQDNLNHQRNRNPLNHSCKKNLKAFPWKFGQNAQAINRATPKKGSIDPTLSQLLHLLIIHFHL
jgi:hypothetical protein